MKSGRKIFLNLLVHGIELGNLLAVYFLFDTFSVFVLYGNLSLYGYGLKVVLFLYGQSDQALCDLTDLFWLLVLPNFLYFAILLSFLRSSRPDRAFWTYLPVFL